MPRAPADRDPESVSFEDVNTGIERKGPDRPSEVTESLRAPSHAAAAGIRACRSAFVPAFLCVIVLILGRPDGAWASHGAGAPTVTGVRPEYVRRLVDEKGNLVLVDLRRPNEYQAGHLPGAISLPIAELEKRYGEIPAAERVVLYCQCPLEDLVSAFLFLHSKGHANLAVLEDGFDGWLRRRYPIAK